jgi:hypothetical protein
MNNPPNLNTCALKKPISYNSASQTREMGLKIGDTIIGKVAWFPYWDELKVKLIWRGASVAVFELRERNSNNLEWIYRGETPVMHLHCREWFLIKEPEVARDLEKQLFKAQRELTVLKDQTELGNILSEASDKLFNELNVKYSEMFKELNNLRQIIKDDCEDDSCAREIALKVLPALSVHGDSHGVPALSDIVESLVLKIGNKTQEIEGQNLILKIYEEQYVHKNEVDKIRGELDSALRQLEHQKRLVKELNDKVIFANDILNQIGNAAHGRALLGGMQEEYLGTVLKINCLAGQGLTKLIREDINR